VKRLWLVLLACGACGDNIGSPLSYTDPTGGKLRLVRGAPTKSLKAINLDLVVGDAPLIGYSVGFDLPIDDTRVTLAAFTTATALDPGSDPVAAKATLPKEGPLAHELVAALSQKAAGTGAVAADTQVAAGAVLFTLELDLVGHAANGVIFDGTTSDFVLPSGGMRDRLGNTVVEAKDVAIGKLELKQ
jgi:hypothetical protein